MVQVNENFLKEVRKESRTKKVEGTRKIGFKLPENVQENRNFVCPLCNYVSRKNQHGSARIYGRWFRCFACNEARLI